MDEHKYMALRDQIVVKSNQLIQQSRFRLNLQQQKIILYLVSQIDYSDDDFKLYSFGIRDFCRICGIDNAGGTQYARLRDGLQQLSDKSLLIHVDPDTETAVRWVEKFYLNKRSGTVQIRLDKDLKPYLLHLRENFTRYELVYTLRMKHKVSPRLYEILKSYHYDDLKPYTKEFSYDELRSLLDAKKKTYEKFKYFNCYVLAPAIDEINEQTDLFVEATPLRSGRTVYAVRFRFERRKPIDILESVAKTDESFRRELVKASKERNSTAGQTQEPKETPRRRDTVIAAAVEPQQPEPDTIIIKAAATPKTDQQPQAQDKPKRLQVRIYIKGQKEKPIKAFSSYDRSDLDQKSNQWLKEQGYQTFTESKGTSFRWEV